jgi:2-hydroxycyclohexanecarboxyl-CoA dehydrogenase
MSGRVALVTGAGAGVGRAAALRLVDDKNATVVAINDLDPERAKAVAAEIDVAGGQGFPVVADVTDWDAVCRMSSAIEEEFGGVDILVNNAGVPVSGAGLAPFVSSSPDDWQPWLAVSLYGTMYATRAVLPTMVNKGWGRIVTVVSDAGRVGESGMTAYATAKAGAAGFTRSIAREVGRNGITANSVALGAIKHGPIGELMTGDFEKQLLKRYIVDRLGSPEDPAAMISFLSGDDAEWITGQTYPVNGGFSVTQ